MDHVKTVAQLCEEHGLDPKSLADKSGLDERRVRAILAGRWTPSPAERDHIAAVFGLTRDDIAWGHTATVQHLYGHGPQFGRTP
jgi:transcriptional regulator with XRE-family HTH domain